MVVPTQYANLDGWDPKTGFDGVATPPVSERPELIVGFSRLFSP